jgi:glycerophosphoryl diester phosphodiesterase
MRSSLSGPDPHSTDPLWPGAAGFAHRGLHGPSPLVENSLAAFEACLEAGAGVECDVRLTRDGEIVVFHDSNALRLTGSDLVIEQAMLAEVRQLPFPGRPVPTLSELLRLVSGRAPMLIEAKCRGRRADWCHALEKTLWDYRGPYGVMSFDALLMRSIRTRLPTMRRGLVINDRLDRVSRRLALWQARPQFAAIETHAVAKAWAQRLRRAMPIYSWTVKSSVQRRALEPFADALIWEGDGRG